MLPAGLKYTSPNIYTIRTAIIPLTPTSTGGSINVYSISPALPPGLTFNTLTGVISGDTVSATGVFDNRLVGNSKSVTPTLAGADAGNYNITNRDIINMAYKILQ